MDIFKILRIDAAVEDIDLAMTPIDTFGFFECRGDMHRVRSRKERYYYFYVDNWRKPARLCFIERGIQHALVLAIIKAPRELIDTCIASQGKTYKEKSFAIDEPIRTWLKKHIITQTDADKITPVSCNLSTPEPAAIPQEVTGGKCKHKQVFLRFEPRIIAETDIPNII